MKIIGPKYLASVKLRTHVHRSSKNTICGRQLNDKMLMVWENRAMHVRSNSDQGDRNVAVKLLAWAGSEAEEMSRGLRPSHSAVNYVLYWWKHVALPILADVCQAQHFRLQS